MDKVLRILALLVTIPFFLQAQVLPKEGSKLHYRIIGFSFPAQEAVIKYKVEIAAGIYNKEDSFKKHIVRAGNTQTNRIILEVPAFGRPYTWRTTCYGKNGKAAKGEFNHFNTVLIPEVDSSQMRVRVLKPAVKYKDAYVFIDGHKTLYDMKGNPVWYLPMRTDVPIGRSEVRDLKLSDRGTITFLQRERAYEINYNGDTLWRTPNEGKISGDSEEHYHHEFTRLANGHYMILGAELVFWAHRYGWGVDTTGIDDETTQDKKKMTNLKIDFGTLIEYDDKGNIVWYWKSSDYFLASDLVNYVPEHRSKVIDVHENAFFFNERDSVIYISFKNISRILKIKYPGGTVINSFGEVFKAGTPPSGNGLFCDQHACKYSRKGYIYLYNNNACNDSNQLPTVLLMKEGAEVNSLEKIWEYQCSVDSIRINPSINNLKRRQKILEQNHLKQPLSRGSLIRATSGGNVFELPDHSIFVCMNAQYSKVFIVSPEKKELWSAVPERFNPIKKDWFSTPQQYRASIITKKQLEQLIWDSEK